MKWFVVNVYSANGQSFFSARCPADVLTEALGLASGILEKYAHSWHPGDPPLRIEVTAS